MAKEPDATAAEKASAEAAGSDQISLIALGSFHEGEAFQGKLLQAGDTFTADRARAVQLRANGLVSYADPDAEKAAAADDPPPSTDGGVPVITTRSFRRKS
jgi:hypothetical protein